ncbi:hypothetical protein TcCL_ESM10328 [Trypanosoma cruzi]|nr:hypothetical protein TcCL_ESM10328 [Trypanosoma cruzi]
MDLGIHRQTMGGHNPHRTCCESPGASNTKFRDSSAPAHRVGVARELGVHQWLIMAERGRSITDYAPAIADARNRNGQPNSQVEEARNNLSARESNIARACDHFGQQEDALAGREQQLEATRAQLQEREARVNAKEAQQAAWEAAATGREDAPTSPRGPTDGPVARQNMAENGDTKQLLRKHRLMTVSASSRTAQRSSAGERRQVIPQTSHDNFG